jgi:diacyltrehalose acyltransferase
VGGQYTPRTRRTLRVLAAVAAAVLMLGHGVEQANIGVGLANTVIGIGGRGDATSANVPAKLSRDIAPAEWGTDYTYYGVPYPADFNFQSSTDAGIPALTQAIADNGASGIRVVGYSEGTLVAEAVKRRLANTAGAPSRDDIDFLFIASPYLPNGGLFARFPGFQIPGLLPDFGPAQPTAYNSTYVTNEYDTYADFPAYFNPLSIANSLLAAMYAHPDQYYDSVDVDNLPAGSAVTTVRNNGAGGSDTYILVYAEHLPLLAPVRQVAAILHLTPFTEPVLAAVEPVIRLAVDAGYTDRTNANPAQPTPFSLITPPAKIAEAVLGVPAALQQGAADAAAAIQHPSPAPTSIPQTGATPLRLAATAVTPQDDAPKTDARKVDATDPEPSTIRTRARITHPTVTSDGNMARPTTTVGGGTPAGGATSETESATPAPASTDGASTPGPTAEPEKQGATPSDPSTGASTKAAA